MTPSGSATCCKRDSSLTYHATKVVLSELISKHIMKDFIYRVEMARKLGLKGAELDVMQAVYHFSGKNGHRLTYTTLMEIFGLTSEGTIANAFRGLEEKGLIEQTRSGNTKEWQATQKAVSLMAAATNTKTMKCKANNTPKNRVSSTLKNRVCDTPKNRVSNATEAAPKWATSATHYEEWRSQFTALSAVEEEKRITATDFPTYCSLCDTHTRESVETALRYINENPDWLAAHFTLASEASAIKSVILSRMA